MSIQYTTIHKEWNKVPKQGAFKVINKNGDVMYVVDGKYHREDGPAREYASGTKKWFLNGKKLSEEEFNQRKNDCNGKVVEIEGKKYRLVSAE